MIINTERLETLKNNLPKHWEDWRMAYAALHKKDGLPLPCPGDLKDLLEVLECEIRRRSRKGIEVPVRIKIETLLEDKPVELIEVKEALDLIRTKGSTIGSLIEKAYENASIKGWHEEERSFGDLVALTHSELSEALEEFRHGRGFNEIYVSEQGKPEGIPIELADAVIRIFDMCGSMRIDLDRAIRLKMKYNETRPHRHGGKVI